MDLWDEPPPTPRWIQAARVLWIAGVLGAVGLGLPRCDPCSGLLGAGDGARVLRGPNTAGVIVTVRMDALNEALGSAIDETLPAVARQRATGDGAVGARASSEAPVLRGRPERCQPCAGFDYRQPIELLAGPAGADPDTLETVGACTIPVRVPVLIEAPAGEPTLPVRTRPDDARPIEVRADECDVSGLPDDQQDAALSAAREAAEARAERLTRGFDLGAMRFWPVQDIGVAPARVEVYTEDGFLRLAMYSARTLAGESIPLETATPGEGEAVAVAVAPSMLSVLAADRLARRGMRPIKGDRPGPGYQPRMRSAVPLGDKLAVSFRASRAEGCGWIDYQGAFAPRWDAERRRVVFGADPQLVVDEIGGSERGRIPSPATGRAMAERVLDTLAGPLEHHPYRGPGGVPMTVGRAWSNRGVVVQSGALGDAPPREPQLPEPPEPPPASPPDEPGHPHEPPPAILPEEE